MTMMMMTMLDDDDDNDVDGDGDRLALGYSADIVLNFCYYTLLVLSIFCKHSTK